jgi:hypothetical protein
MPGKLFGRATQECGGPGSTEAQSRLRGPILLKRLAAVTSSATCDADLEASSSRTVRELQEIAGAVNPSGQRRSQ